VAADATSKMDNSSPSSNALIFNYEKKRREQQARHRAAASAPSNETDINMDRSMDVKRNKKKTKKKMHRVHDIPSLDRLIKCNASYHERHISNVSFCFPQYISESYAVVEIVLSG
jgi:acetoin utilization deacetylase AcuC-like enzyme